MHADETGINIGGKLHWMHAACSAKFAAFFPHTKRGEIAMQAMDILPHFRGTLCHDHWKAYFKLDCKHALCNAHHLRELQAVVENDGFEWAHQMRSLLVFGNKMVRSGQGRISKIKLKRFLAAYAEVLRRGETQCPPRDLRNENPNRGRIAQSKARNLLRRLGNFQKETLRFLYDPLVPFTNNQGERDIRMTKVHQKVSGCFRSFTGAQIFCRIRGYLVTCQRHDVRPADALKSLFSGFLPAQVSYLL